jgi:hypothetical protein
MNHVNVHSRSSKYNGASVQLDRRKSEPLANWEFSPDYPSLILHAHLLFFGDGSQGVRRRETWRWKNARSTMMDS